MIFVLRIDANEEIAFDESLTMLDQLPVFMAQRGGRNTPMNPSVLRNLIGVIRHKRSMKWHKKT